MGYTHYWRQNGEIPTENWDAITKCVKHLYKNLPNGIKIQVEWDNAESPVANAKEIRFNGVGEAGHETFLLEKNPSSHFEFCKTARKPYDLVVQMVLTIIYHYASKYISVSSDGGPEDWEICDDECQKMFGFSGIKL